MKEADAAQSRLQDLLPQVDHHKLDEALLDAKEMPATFWDRLS